MDPAVAEAAMAAAGAFIEELMGSGAFVFAGGLHPPSTAVTVDNTGESLIRTDGPFVEAPEYLGGFWVIDVADHETAVDWASKASKALESRVEVRALQEAPEEADQHAS
ncbi:YciI family protein [Nocardioides sp. zg-1308]|uniref:YciI family protein n=1 Tax=Nocardioides sp. zg-1308 TaxID=2736253 RepID=UPI0020A68BC1|nr:YciI family protein [Nocardioides sp. zg-1308]